MAHNSAYAMEGCSEPRSWRKGCAWLGRSVVTALRPLALLRVGLLCSVLVAFLAAAPEPAAAHVPGIPEDGRDLGSATAVGDPFKSSAFYGRLDAGGSARYFAMDLQDGDRLRLSLLTPDDSPFAPSLVVMGPGLVPEGSVPAFIESPPGAGSMVVTGRRTIPDYEPFTPGAYYFTAELDLEVPASGRYYVAVFEPQHAGGFSLAVGYREQFSVGEWVLLPYSLFRVHLWEGDGLLLAVGPAVLVVLLGLGLVAWRLVVTRRRLSIFQWVAIVSGLLYVGTAANVLGQMIQAAVVTGLTGGMAITVAFVALPVAAGAVILRFGWKMDAPTLGVRIGLAVLGIAGVGLLAGFLAGPALALIAAALPRRIAAIGSAQPAAAPPAGVVATAEVAAPAAPAPDPAPDLPTAPATDLPAGPPDVAAGAPPVVEMDPTDEWITRALVGQASAAAPILPAADSPATHPSAADLAPTAAPAEESAAVAGLVWPDDTLETPAPPLDLRLWDAAQGSEPPEDGDAREEDAG